MCVNGYLSGLFHYLESHGNCVRLQSGSEPGWTWHHKVMTTALETATPADTRNEITRLSARGYTQVRGVLVQLPDRKGPRASTLARMVHERRHRALLAYLMLLTSWPWLEDRRQPLEAGVLIRALTVEASGRALTWSPSTLSRTWADLEDLNLIERRRENRLVRVLPRREDGGADYEKAAGRRDLWNAYFSLPDEFWTTELFAELSLPALAMLLVIAKETNGKAELRLTYPQADEWYGIKAKTAQNGIAELLDRGLAYRRTTHVKAALSPIGRTSQMWYSLTGPFGYESRKALQERAAKLRRKRLGTVPTPPPATASTAEESQP